MRGAEELERRRAELESELGEHVTLDALTGDFRIFQRRRGHRHSVDDLLTAWYAATHVEGAPETILDLGTGIGSVGLALAWRFPTAEVTGIEVQEISFRLLRENVWANEVEARVRILHGDLRDFREGSHPLVTGSPPYFDVKTGIVSADPQRAGARFELRGDVTDYCRAAERTLSPDGLFVFCFPTVQRARALRAVEDAQLRVRTMRDVVPKEGIAPLFSLFSCGRSGEMVVEPPFVVRDASGAHTEEMLAARAVFGHHDQRARP
ncbi:MAG: tRNA1(Val) (adenine(37)-N6)-methyltransferase [Polyangiales bacterium]